MIVRHWGAALLTSALLVAPPASAETKASNARSIAVQASIAAHASADTRAKATLHGAVTRNLAEERLTDSLSSYTISPSVVQLRRYVEVGRHPKLVCIVDLALQDGGGALIAIVRGRATTVGATPTEAIFAATHAAVVRIPAALQASRPLQISAIAAERPKP